MTETARDWQDLDEFHFRGAWNPKQVKPGWHV